MSAFFALFFTVCFFALVIELREIKAYRGLIYFFLTILIILFSGLRAQGVGADDISYVEQFSRVHSYFSPFDGKFSYSLDDENMEVGYVALSALVKYFTDDYTYLFLLVAAISVGINAYNYYQYSAYPLLVLLLYFAHPFLHKDMNAIRSAIAAAILLFSIKQLYFKNDKKVFLIILLASLFHISSLAAFFPYFLYKINFFSKRNILIGLIASTVIGFFGAGHIILNNLPDMGLLTQKLSYYLAWEIYNYSLGLFDLVNIKNIIILTLALFFWGRMESKVPYFNVLIAFYASAVFFRIIFNDFALVAGRVSSVIGITEVILLASFVSCFKNKAIASIPIIFYASLMLVMNLANPVWGSGQYSVSIFK